MVQDSPVAPYLAVGISSTVYGIGSREDITINLEHVEECIHAVQAMANINLPIKIIALAEGALTGFTDEVFDVPHVTAANDLFIDIPGEETDYLGRLADHYDTYIIGQSKARWPEVMDDRYFNTTFIIDPNGEVVHKAPKNHVWSREHSCTPHDVYDIWVDTFGDGIDAFYPVLKTDDIGNIGTMVCSDGEYPEAVRALAMNGAEVVYRPSEAVPMTTNTYPGGGGWMIQNQGHAQFNSVYMLSPNVGPVYPHPKARHPIDVSAGSSHIVDYQGRIDSYNASARDTFVGSLINIEELRNFRTMNLNSNWTKDLRTELFKTMYDEPIHPKNLFIDQPPHGHAEEDAVRRENIQRLIDRGTYTPPFHDFEGAKFYPGALDPEQEKWENVKTLWEGK